MAKTVELRRHTDNDDDQLSEKGVAGALEIGGKLHRNYEIVITSGAQRATQTAACFLAVMPRPVAGGVVVDESFRSRVEERWKEAYQRAGAGDIKSLRAVDPDLVDDEAQHFRTALEGLFNRLADGGAALVVGHSPMLEAAVYGLVGKIVEPFSKGQGVAVTQTDDGNFKAERA